METLETKTTVQALIAMAASDVGTQDRICEHHGAFVDFRGPDGWTGCGMCRQPIKAELQRVTGLMAAEAHRARANSLLGRAAIPERFADRRLDNFLPHSDGPTKALAIAQAYADNFDQARKTGASLIFCGGVGSGKTHLAVGIAHAVIAMDKVAVFTSVVGAIRTVKDTYRRDSDIKEAQAIAKLIEPDLLILDEVGVQFGSETEKMILFEIINGRYERLKPTIVISNLAKDALTDYLGERVVDRLREGGGRMVIFDWPSYRRLAGQGEQS